MYRGEFHIHSRYSYDGVLDPEWILKRASALGMNVLSITDHESMEGSLKAQEAAKRWEIEVWPGMEIATNAGDIIGIGLHEEVRARDWEVVVREIRHQGGVVILPHPFRGHRMVERLAASADIVEVFNGRDSPANIKRAAELARSLGKPGLAGSDAHVASELGNAMNSFDDIMGMNKEYVTKRSNRLEKTFSYLVKDAKKRSFSSVPRDLLRLIR
jgi:predicted metal-dependent phosphoesterase TrpH